MRDKVIEYFEIFKPDFTIVRDIAEYLEISNEETFEILKKMEEIEIEECNCPIGNKMIFKKGEL